MRSDEIENFVCFPSVDNFRTAASKCHHAHKIRSCNLSGRCYPAWVIERTKHNALKICIQCFWMTIFDDH